MPTFDNIQELKRVLRDEGIFLKPHFSQNFLMNEVILEEIVAAGDPGPEDVALEVGPGLGVLTEQLLKRVNYLLAVEKDRDWCGYLEKQYGTHKEFSLKEGDILKLDPKELSRELAAKSEPPGRVLLFGNLPYSITTPILTHLVYPGHPYARAVFMMQKEVAERLCAPSGTKTYGAISVFTQYFSVPHIVRVVKRGNFYPVPSVDSAIIVLDFITRPEKIDQKTFSDFVRACFRTRRKTLKNALKGWSGLAKYDIDDLTPVFEAAGFTGKERAEELSVDDYLKLFSVISNF